MKFKGIKKLEGGKFITRYDIEYETVDGQQKIYEMISRNPDMKTYDELRGEKADSVVLMIHSTDGEKILLNREFRMSSGSWVYNLPAGLIDPGEDIDAAAARELREETGLTLTSIEDRLGLSYSAVGFSNEMNVCIVGTAEGEIQGSDSVFEEIEAAWYTKEQVRELLGTERFAARTQSYCYMWAKR